MKNQSNKIENSVSMVLETRFDKNASPLKLLGQNDTPIVHTKNTLLSILRSLRFHHWSKNLLLFVPLLCAHEISDTHKLFHVILSFFSFSLCSSGVYIINDILDVDADRQHFQKKTRPFANNELRVRTGILMALCLFTFSVLLGLTVSIKFTLVLLCYLAIAIFYSIQLKKIVLIDVLTLSLLYTLRIIAGHFSGEVRFSSWLLGFSVFFFLGLAFLKRYIELKHASASQTQKLLGRGYHIEDISLITSLGVITSYISILVFSVYLASEEVSHFHPIPQVLWGEILILTYWVSYIWLKTSRGLVTSDPVAFALKDRQSIICGLLVIFIMLTAAIHPH